MTAKEISTIGKKVSPILPDYMIKGSLLFRITPEGLLLGLSFSASQLNSRSFRVHALFLPLFVPTETIHYNYDKRLGSGGGNWNADAPDLIDDLTASIRNEAIPFLTSVSELEHLPGFIRSTFVPVATGYVNPHSQEALAYILIKLNDVAGAIAVLSQIQKMLNKTTVHWELAIMTRTKIIEEKLLQNPEAALAQLDIWKKETIRKLGLEKHVSTA